MFKMEVGQLLEMEDRQLFESWRLDMCLRSEAGQLFEFGVGQLFEMGGWRSCLIISAAPIVSTCRICTLV